MCRHFWRVLKSANYFNLRHFSYQSSERLQKRNAKSTQSTHPQTFAASEPVSYHALLCPAISCPAVSCSVIWSVTFTSVTFTSSIFSAPDFMPLFTIMCRADHSPRFCCFRSFSTVRSHVWRGRPRGHLRSFGGLSMPALRARVYGPQQSQNGWCDRRLNVGSRKLGLRSTSYSLVQTRVLSRHLQGTQTSELPSPKKIWPGL